MKFTRSETMARVRSRHTSPELRLRKALWAEGVRFRVAVPLPGTPDIVIPSRKIAVFVDGCFWHGCPVHYTSPVANADFWRSKLARNQARDAAADAALKNLGWRVVRLWEHEVEEHLTRVVRRLLPRRPKSATKKSGGTKPRKRPRPVRKARL